MITGEGLDRMLKTSDVAKLLHIKNEQVMALVDFGFLRIADISRHEQGFSYLFSEDEVYKLDASSCLAQIEEWRSKRRIPKGKGSDFKAEMRAIKRYDRFLQSIEETPCAELLLAAFYLFHLNHYAKKYVKVADELYALKHRVLKKMVERFGLYLELAVLLGPDKYRIWLCEECRMQASEMGMSYREYIAEGNSCPKCEVQVKERDYYSLLEIAVSFDKHSFCFHMPRHLAAKWELEWDRIPCRDRLEDDSRDRMCLYGRRITNIEERVFPLPAVIDQLQRFLEL